jgi:hypothetical protein
MSSESASSAVDCAIQPIAASIRNIEALIAKSATSSLSEFFAEVRTDDRKAWTYRTYFLSRFQEADYNKAGIRKGRGFSPNSVFY